MTVLRVGLVFTAIFLAPEVHATTMVNVLMTFVFAIRIIAEIIVMQILVVNRKGCLQIVKSSSGYQVSMYGSVSAKSAGEIFEIFQENFQTIFNDKTIKKVKVETIYINTHEQFCRGILMLLTQNMRYYKQNMDVLASEGGY